MDPTANAPGFEAYWMPFTARTASSRPRPRMLASAKGMHYTATDGRSVLDGTAASGA